jgi:hypothetical protein
VSDRIESGNNTRAGVVDAALKPADAIASQGPVTSGRVVRPTFEQVRAEGAARQAQLREVLDRIEARLKRQIAAAEARLEAWKASQGAVSSDRGADAASRRVPAHRVTRFGTACGAD